MAQYQIYGSYDYGYHGNDDEYRSMQDREEPEPDEELTDETDDFPYASKADRDYFNRQNT